MVQFNRWDWLKSIKPGKGACFFTLWDERPACYNRTNEKKETRSSCRSEERYFLLGEFGLGPFGFGRLDGPGVAAPRFFGGFSILILF